MLIRLEYEGRTLHEIHADEISDEIVIGRGHDCAWKVHKDDPVVSSRHAAVFRKGRAIWIRDLGSKNGTFMRGKRIVKHKLKIGHRVGLGNHVLWVESARAGVTGKPVSDIQVLTGRTRGQRKPVMPPGLTIGSDPVCGLALLDPLVSRQHAEISVKEDGSCWIRDLGSKNGTMVNQLPLREEKERLLKEGDRIGIAHLEIEFHDGAVKKQSSQAWLRLGVIAATVVVAMGLYGTQKLMRPAAEKHIEKARALAAGEDFPRAREELEKAGNARRAEANKVEIENLRRMITVWEGTVQAWQRAVGALEKGDWVEASRQLGELQDRRKEAWTWNERAPGEKEKAARAKAMLDILFRGGQSLKREDVSFADLRRDQEAADQALETADPEMPPFMARLKTEADDIRAKLGEAVRESRVMEKAMDELNGAFPAYADILKALEQVAGKSEGALRRRATQALEPLRALAASFSKLHEMAGMARAMEFEKLAGMDFELPSADACAVDARVSKARLNVERILEKLKTSALRVSHMCKDIQKRMEAGTGVAPGLDLLDDPGALGKVFACDTLGLPFPKRNRAKPQGEYDRLLGIEEFYTSLRMLPEKLDPAMADWPFPSQLTQTAEMCVRIRELDVYLNHKDNNWMLLQGKLADELRRYNALAARGEAAAANMLRRAESATGREALIAGGIAYFLARDPKETRVKDKPLVSWLVTGLKESRAEMARMSSEFAAAGFDKQIEIRERILQTGLPGDPVVRQMWVMRTAAMEK